MKIILNLTESQADLLVDVISNYWDEGPYGEGWQSHELGELSDIVGKVITETKKNAAKNLVEDFLKVIKLESSDAFG